MEIEIKYPQWSPEERVQCPDAVRQMVFYCDHEYDHREKLEEIFDGFNAGSGLECRLFSMTPKMRSMSVGDFVRIEDQWYQCASGDWIKVTPERVEEVMAMSSYYPYADPAVGRR